MCVHVRLSLLWTCLQLCISSYSVSRHHLILFQDIILFHFKCTLTSKFVSVTDLSQLRCFGIGLYVYDSLSRATLVLYTRGSTLGKSLARLRAHMTLLENVVPRDDRGLAHHHSKSYVTVTQSHVQVMSYLQHRINHNPVQTWQRLYDTLMKKILRWSVWYDNVKIKIFTV